MAEDDVFDSGPVIYGYSRAQALEDGALIDVTADAKQVGFMIPVAITQALHTHLTPSEEDK